MILRLYLFSLYATLFLTAGLAAILIFNVNPYQSPFWLILIFYFAFLLFWASLLAIIGYYLKVWMSNREVIFAHLVPTLRQSLFIAVGITGLLFLQQMRVLNWWVGALFVIAIFLAELFFRKEKYAR